MKLECEASSWPLERCDYFGRLQIRHRITPMLEQTGGHIGYDVRASARRRGYATAMLTEALPYARELGIDRALITCEKDNHASRRVIERHGGVLDDERAGKLRYWVPTIRVLPPRYRVPAREALHTGGQVEA